ncbi:hypothetical protein [Deinococcus budaensis]|uniref:Uncharacterized protein n=1 Tax=Deinococcus budaensis TaxID=1665626 RepID=A0A7W8GC87_9DEIO|nr:hypothetical protein [Deinococcus budaensis]MBB5232733.1 hypothetical protein [Deinococcus budaensis]
MLPDAVAWIVHPLAGLALALWGSVIFSRRGRHAAEVGRAAAILVLLAVLGAGWAVHPAAGMLLGYLGSRGFHRWQRDWRALLVGVLAGLVFLGLGATWLVFPLVVMGIVWLTTAGFTAGSGRRPQAVAAPTSPPPLPEQAGGFPVGSFGNWAGPAGAYAERREARRQARRARKLSKRQREAADLAPLPPPPAPAPALPPAASTLAAYVRDDRLPGEARAQLAALDLRTREALTHLEALGQQGSEAAYLARAVREEYAPGAVRAYLKLPPTLASTQPLEGGKTGRDLLREQLDLLLNAVQDILGTALRSGGQDLLTHQRFLEEKFRKPRGDLEV